MEQPISTLYLALNLGTRSCWEVSQFLCNVIMSRQFSLRTRVWSHPRAKWLQENFQLHDVNLALGAYNHFSCKYTKLTSNRNQAALAVKQIGLDLYISKAHNTETFCLSG